MRFLISATLSMEVFKTYALVSPANNQQIPGLNFRIFKELELYDFLWH